MPPPTQFEGVFWGDYTGLAALNGTAHPAWSDTRTPELVTCPGGGAPKVCTQTVNGLLANDQEAFTDSLSVPAR